MCSSTCSGSTATRSMPRALRDSGARELLALGLTGAVVADAAARGRRRCRDDRRQPPLRARRRRREARRRAVPAGQTHTRVAEAQEPAAPGVRRRRIDAAARAAGTARIGAPCSSATTTTARSATRARSAPASATPNSTVSRRCSNRTNADASPFGAGRPPSDADWVEPAVVVEVRFSEWTSAGAVRHPAYLGTRDDKPATDVGREG